MSVDLDAIRARLAASTPGPWAAGIDIDPADGYWSTENVHAVDAVPVAILRRDEDHTDEQINEFDATHDRGVVAETHNYTTIPDEQHDANQRLIAHAPADLAALLNLVDTLIEAGHALIDAVTPGEGFRSSAAFAEWRTLTGWPE